MNVEFIYLYRDADNYKKSKTLIFDNPDNLPPTEAEKRIVGKLDESTYFKAQDVGIADLTPDQENWDDEADHDWHEFVSLENTVQEENLEGRTILEFVKCFEENANY